MPCAAAGPRRATASKVRLSETRPRLGLLLLPTQPLRARRRRGGGGGLQRRPAAAAGPPADSSSSSSSSSAAPPAPAPLAALPAAVSPAWRWEDSPDAVRTYAALLGVLGAGALPAAQSHPLADLPYFIALAVVTIYAGAHRGLAATQRQQISFRESALAPLAASAALGAAYALVKFWPDLRLQSFFDAYFWLLGTVAAVGAFGPPARVLGAAAGLPRWRVPIPAWLGATDAATGAPAADAELAATDAVVLAAALALATADLAAGHGNFTLNNAIACLVAADILQLVGLSSFRAAALLLGGLLAYDVFWVFGSPAVFGDNVMLSVATSDALVGPTRLLFPRPPGSVGEASDFPFSLLGLGDVAVPGLLACLALRYDASRAVDLRARGEAAAAAMLGALSGLAAGASAEDVKAATSEAAIAAYDGVADLQDEQRARSQGAGGGGATGTVCAATSDAVLHQRTYFTPVLLAYVAGLGAAFAANAVTHLGQPALLYLCPLTLGAVAGTAALRGELPRVLNYTDTKEPAPPAAVAAADGDD